jgi:hypothetical protein
MLVEVFDGVQQQGQQQATLRVWLALVHVCTCLCCALLMMTWLVAGAAAAVAPHLHVFSLHPVVVRCACCGKFASLCFGFSFHV